MALYCIECTATAFRLHLLPITCSPFNYDEWIVLALFVTMCMTSLLLLYFKWCEPERTKHAFVACLIRIPLLFCSFHELVATVTRIRHFSRSNRNDNWWKHFNHTQHLFAQVHFSWLCVLPHCALIVCIESQSNSFLGEKALKTHFMHKCNRISVQ